MRLCPVESVKPHALMIAPMYVLLKANEKLVGVKAPLDFFTVEELARYREHGYFYAPPSVDWVLPFRDVGRSIRALLKLQLAVPDPERIARQKPSEIELSPSPFEVSDAVLRALGPLWSSRALIEPFFMSALVAELCDPIPPAELVAAREADVDGFERAILLSAWSVFIALHLGQLHLPFLDAVRRGAFAEETGRGEARSGAVRELVAAARASWAGVDDGVAGIDLVDRLERVSQKIGFRMKRVVESLAIPESDPATVFGKAGFRDAA